MPCHSRTVMKEVWKWIPGFENFYKVSNLGRIKSVNPRHSYKNCKFIILKGGLEKDNYRHVVLSVHGKQKTMKIHHAVLNAFVGPCPTGLQACHFPDPNPSNNRLDNLSWGTPKRNQKHRLKHGTSKRLLTPKQVAYVRKKCKVKKYGQQRKIAKELGVGEYIISSIVTNKGYQETPNCRASAEL